MPKQFKDATIDEENDALQLSWKAFREYRKLNLKERSAFLHTIASQLNKVSSTLIPTAGRETNLDETRLKDELNRTIFQLRSYGDACAEGTWLDIRIDTADANRMPPKPDLRKMLIPVGPVIVFGSSNFPFAYSTAGGDTACALAAGCPVIVKAHPAHAGTSTIVANAILSAAEKYNMPKGVFAHVYGASIQVGKALVTHTYTKAVGFTGSYIAGRQ